MIGAVEATIFSSDNFSGDRIIAGTLWRCTPALFESRFQSWSTNFQRKSFQYVCAKSSMNSKRSVMRSSSRILTRTMTKSRTTSQRSISVEKFPVSALPPFPLAFGRGRRAHPQCRVLGHGRIARTCVENENGPLRFEDRIMHRFPQSK